MSPCAETASWFGLSRSASGLEAPIFACHRKNKTAIGAVFVGLKTHIRALGGIFYG